MILLLIFEPMYIRQTKKVNSKSGKVFKQYILVQAFRLDGKAKQKNILYLGSDDFLSDKSLRMKIAKALEEKIYKSRVIDSLSFYNDLGKQHQTRIDQWYAKYIEKNNDPDEGSILSVPSNSANSNFELVDTNSIDTHHCREVGAEWLCLNAAKDLGIDNYLSALGYSSKEVDLALLAIISRMVYPASEHKTAQWLDQNSALWELFDTMESSPNRFSLYRTALKLSSHFDDFTNSTYNQTMDIFGLEDTMMIYDLTNTYFEGRKLTSIMAQFSRSKEKRSDCKLTTISAVVNKQGFLQYSKIMEGNISEPGTLLDMIKQLNSRSGHNKLDKVLVIDAGIVTEDNLTALRTMGQKYVCVSRTKLKDYEQYNEGQEIEILDNRKNKINIKLVAPRDKPDRWMIVKSEMKALKEQSMSNKLEKRFEQQLIELEQGIHLKRRIKKVMKVWERIGRIKQQNKSVSGRYEIKVAQDKDGIATSITWSKKDALGQTRQGVYFIRTNIETDSEKEIWNLYNTIREVESTFRCLKTDLNIRPIFHQRDESSTAHIHLGLMAYQLVAYISHQLKQNELNLDWSNIVRTMNSLKLNTFSMKLKTKEMRIRKTSVPEHMVRQIYSILGIDTLPKTKTKHVVYH